MLTLISALMATLATAVACLVALVAIKLVRSFVSWEAASSTAWYRRVYPVRMKAHQILALQQQAQANRSLEKIAAAQTGAPAPKPSWFKRWVLGVKH